MFFVCLTLLEVSITAYVLGLIEISSSGIILALFLISFFALNLYISYLIKKTADINRLKYELMLSRKQVDIQLRHYKALIAKQEKSRKIIHDAKNHLLTVENLFLNSDKIKGEEYAQILYNKLDELTYDFKCSNIILGVIVSSKLQEAEEKEIKLTPTIDDIPIDFINDFDITGIFTNLLNNSFEECDNLPRHLKWINLVVRRINDFLVINVTNPTKSVPEVVKKVYTTTKTGHEGLGLSIVLGIVEKYNGSFIAEVVEEKFIAKITIPF